MLDMNSTVKAKFSQKGCVISAPGAVLTQPVLFLVGAQNVGEKMHARASNKYQTKGKLHPCQIGER